MAKFGTLLRATRSAANVSLGTVARHLEIKVSHLSDVELGRRRPLSAARIKMLAELLKVDPMKLILAAAEEKGVFELETQNVSARAREVVAALARELPVLDEGQLDTIEKALRPKGGR